MIIVVMTLGASLQMEDLGYGKFVRLLEEFKDEADMPKYELVEITPLGLKMLDSGMINPRRMGFVQTIE